MPTEKLADDVKVATPFGIAIGKTTCAEAAVLLGGRGFQYPLDANLYVVMAAKPGQLYPSANFISARCLGNLLDNARRHASRVVLTVEAVQRQAWHAEGSQVASWAVVTLDDNGPGIPPAQREEAFRAFATSRPDGSGLGLAIARDIVRAHGGELVLEDSPLGGLRARLRLPA